MPHTETQRPPGVTLGYLVMCDSNTKIASAFGFSVAVKSNLIGPGAYAVPKSIPGALAEARQEAFREAARAQAHADLDADKDDSYRVYWVAEIRRAEPGNGT